MSKQTSQMYGIKVKETINYAEMGDISLYYEDALWTVKSNFENVWRDGVHYDKGDTIVTFQDGEVATFTMMGQHTDVSPYINKLYSVYSNASENPQAGNISVEYRVTNSDRPHGGYSEVYEIVIFKLVNGLIQDRKYISSEDVRKYKMTCDKPVPAWNLTVDWNYTNPQSGYPMKSWVIRSNSNYIKYEEQYYKVGEDLDVFEYNDPILMAITDETQKHETKKKVGEPPLVVVTERVDGGKPTSWSWNREDIVHDVLHTHKDVYYNGHRHKAMYLLYSKTSVAGAYKTVKGLAFAWADPYWFLVTNAEGMEYNGQILKKGQLIKAWSPGDSLNLYVKKDTAVRKPKTDVPYDNIAYELLATGDTNVTVIRLVNDEEPPDSRVVVATSDSPKVCWGIELRVEGPNWTIYSKNNFIKYNGRTYKKNKSILSFGLDEELHIEIKDEENKYYIKSSITYHVTNEAADSVNYKVRTSKIDHNIIIEKSVNGSEEPWVRVNTYDAIIMPYDYEDLSLEFNTVNRSWILRALSDNVYSDGVKYDTNETIAEWHYTEIKELNHIEALKDSEENIKVAATTTGGGTEFGQEFDEFVPDDYQDFEVLHSSTKALWKVLSNSDDTWISGINYRKGDVILEVADKTFVDPFTVSVRYYDESQHAYSYRTYYISLTYSALTNKTNLIIDPTNGNPIVFNDKTVNEGDVYSITKQNAKSMYGYIWKRDMPGPGPVWSRYDMLVSAVHRSSYRYYVKMIGVKPGTRIELINSSSSSSSLSNYRCIGQQGDDFYYLGGGEKLSVAYDYGRTLSFINGFESGTNVLTISGVNSVICEKYVDSTTYVFQRYTVFGSSASKVLDNKCSHPYNGYVYKWVCDYPILVSYSVTDNTSGCKKYNLSDGSTYDPDVDIVEYNDELKSEWNYTITDPDTGYIESRRVTEFSPIPNKKIIIGDSIYLISGPITCTTSGGYAHIPGSGFTYMNFNWEYCAYRFNINGLSSMITNFMSNSEYAECNVSAICAYYNNKYYGSDIDWSGDNVKIFCFDTRISCVKTISRSSSKIRIKLYQSRDCSEYEYFDLYFDGRAYSYANKEFGFSGLYSANKIDSKRFYIEFRVDVNSTSQICILIDNPLLEESIGNFAFFETLV